MEHNGVDIELARFFGIDSRRPSLDQVKKLGEIKKIATMEDVRRTAVKFGSPDLDRIWIHLRMSK